jgi:CheY-like chemotaxis protein
MPKVLVADDDRVISHLVTSLLRQEGHQVVPAFDGMQSMMFAMRPPQPDLIILDIQMPGGSGLDTLKKLKASSKTMLIPVIILSGTASPEIWSEVEALGAVATLRKPVDRDALLDAVSQALGVPRKSG